MEKQSKGGWLCIRGIFFPVYLLLCVITDLLFVICNLALSGAADAAGVQLAASQRSGFSDFLFRAAAESQERITSSSEKKMFSTPKPVGSFQHTRVFLDSRVKVACSKPQSCCSPLSSLPQLLAFSPAVSIINQAVLKDSLCKLACRESGVRLPALTSEFRNKTRMLAPPVIKAEVISFYCTKIFVLKINSWSFVDCSNEPLAGIPGPAWTNS